MADTLASAEPPRIAAWGRQARAAITTERHRRQRGEQALPWPNFSGLSNAEFVLVCQQINNLQASSSLQAWIDQLNEDALNDYGLRAMNPLYDRYFDDEDRIP
ncbi:hypothetical protein [Mycolicibacterium palauense]|uniref:hypothetical protein n=1 Tax=Mycolicibacterium palauense TaxID=2034511 RepID=UPI0011458D5F|nr:hypothetical protein [Mycolicibacterium palauense]